MGGGRGTLRIGGNGPSAATSFVGLIAHAFVYGAALSVAELDHLRGVRLAKPTAGNAGYVLRLRRELGSYVEVRGHMGALFAARFNADGNYCLTCGADRALRLWGARTATGRRARAARSW